MNRCVVSVLALSSMLTLAACRPAPLVGAACSRPADCQQPLLCRSGRCRTPCRLDSECPLGATCLLDLRREGTCGVPQDRGCERGAPCDASLICVGDRCAVRCADASGCAPDGICAPAIGRLLACFDSRTEIPDAALGDGGPGDGGAPADSDSPRDTNATDASATDTGAGAPDAGAADTGAADTGAADTGAADTGAADTGAADTGAADTGVDAAG